MTHTNTTPLPVKRWVCSASAWKTDGRNTTFFTAPFVVVAANQYEAHGKALDCTQRFYNNEQGFTGQSVVVREERDRPVEPADVTPWQTG